MTTSPFADRRASARAPVSVPVIYGAEGTWLEGRVVDVSASGIGLTGPRPFPVKAEIELRFGQVGQEAYLLSVRAVVRHTLGSRMGLEFVNLGAGDHRKMLDTIRQLTAHVRA